MKPPEKSFQRIQVAVQASGAQKNLALELGLSDTEVSRLLHQHLPQICRLIEHLGLEVVDAGHVEDLRKVLKVVL